MIKTKLSIIFFVLIFICSCDYFEYENNKYSTFEELKLKSEPGNWLPNLLPESARNIQESHYVDNPESWGSFEVMKGDDIIFLKECSTYSENKIEKIVTRKKLSWLAIDKNKKFFLCKKNTLFAVEQTDRIITIYFLYKYYGI